MRAFSLAVAIAAVSIATPALAGLDGSTVSVQYYHPDLMTPYGNASATPPSFIVGFGPESVVNLEGVTFITIDFANDSLTLDFSTVLSSPTFNNSAFNGLVFSGSGFGSISSVTVDPLSTFGLSPANASISGNDLHVNWTGVSYKDGQTLTLHFNTAGVPEPAAWALLIAGFGTIGAVVRRQRRPARA